MTAYPFAIELLQVLILLLGLPRPLPAGSRRSSAACRGARTPGILQPYRDIAKLFAKEVILAENASWIFRFTPYLVFGVTVMMRRNHPADLASTSRLAATADVIALVMLFAIVRFFTALAGMDIGTAFGGMGSSREMTIASLAEPAMLMAIFTVSLGSQFHLADPDGVGHGARRALILQAVARLCPPRLHHDCPDRDRTDSGRQSGDPPGTDDDP